MTILKNKVQLIEYGFRQDKISQLKGEANQSYETEKSCHNELKQLLAQNVSDYDSNRFSVTLKKEHRKILQRKGLLTTYLKTQNRMHNSRNLYHSQMAKVKRLRNVDFPDW